MRGRLSLDRNQNSNTSAEKGPPQSLYDPTGAAPTPPEMPGAAPTPPEMPPDPVTPRRSKRSTRTPVSHKDYELYSFLSPTHGFIRKLLLVPHHIFKERGVFKLSNRSS